MTDKNVTLAQEIIDRNIYCTVATVDADGQPWSTPLFFHYDSEYALYVTSAIDSLHVQNWQVNPRISVSIFDSNTKLKSGNAVYMEAKVAEISIEELPGALEIFYRRTHPLIVDRQPKGVSDYSGTSPRRLFRIIPQHVYVIDSRGHPVYKSLVDVRVEVDLAPRAST
ncbi:hypothetical protein A2973_00095 [Candidatus Gottesmanbacteria bacterium RIFCSPLOWO2_01_FULL_49_10]|uniref:Pyridoxamine 5'-phosphate oxidase N-terminal domain-containing protein n=1 Tax=Candidatus Gottesmanbacteria bacterium RIFCSPLOWO2_01_FULL_49_10 TaxID=1798396 RepID=A0A1F6B1H1_9BACT|nr:MAG: hypothetical protein A2973_00095 [Candidatus Gottesmanbacteria bacterium RIFCSPLOWO2_01_FULL_49_10]